MRPQPASQGDAQVGAVTVDAGFRRWYQSCPCCLSHACPEAKRLLDEERITQSLEEHDQDK
jgi:hypothetical protein